jgi:hypothetical protein
VLLLAVLGSPLRGPTAQAADGSGVVHVRSTPEHGQAVIARTGTDGKIHLVFQTHGVLRYASSSDEGQTFGRSLPVVTGKPAREGLEYMCWDMVVGHDGRVHVMLGTNAWKLKLPQDEWGGFYVSLAPGGTEFSPPRNISRRPSEGFALAAAPDGKLTVCWLADKLYANISPDNGVTFGETVEIDPRLDPCNCCTISATYGADGRLAILYREETNNDRDMYLILWDQTGTDLSRLKVSQQPWKIDTCPMTYYTVFATPKGYLAAWPTQGKIFLAGLNTQGSRTPQGEIATVGKAGHRTDVRCMQNTLGENLIAWKFEDRLYWQLYSDKLAPIGFPDSVASSGKAAAITPTPTGPFIAFP